MQAPRSQQATQGAPRARGASAGDGGLEGFSLDLVELGEAGVGGDLLQDVRQALVHLLEQVDDAHRELLVDGVGAEDLAEDDDDLGQPLVLPLGSFLM